MQESETLIQEANILNECTGPLLGEIPYVGHFLSGVFEANATENFNADLLNILSSIESTLENLTSELKALSAEVAMNQLYASENEAQSTIETWYTNHVSPWLQGNNTGNTMNGNYISTSEGVGLEIQNNCTSLLDDINNAILGSGDFNSGKWLDLAIQQFLAMNDETRAKQTVSFVETSYQYFLKLTHLQMVGVTCLRAINSDQLGQYTYQVLSNIINQGIACQAIVDSYMSNDQFTWIGNLPNYLSPTYLTVVNEDSNRYFSLGQMNGTGATGVAAGIEFDPPADGNQWGHSFASAQLTPVGGLEKVSWASVIQSNSYAMMEEQSGPFDHIIGYMNFSTDDITLEPGQVITGLQPNIDPIGGMKTGSDIDTNGLFAGVIFQNIAANGQLDGNPQANTQANTNWGPSTHFVTTQQYSLLPPPVCNSPLTGFGYCQNRNQVAIKLQTSIHANAFSPKLITSGDYISIYSPVLKAYLTYNSATNSVSFETERTFDLTQNFQIQGGSVDPTNPAYEQNCGIVYLGPEGPLSLIAPSTVGDPISFGPGSYAQGDADCGWMLENPANLNNDYGTDPTPNIYNWSAVLFQNQGRFLEADTNSESATVNNPAIVTNGGTVQSVNDSSYVWNIIPGNIVG